MSEPEIHVDDVGTLFEVTITDPVSKRSLNISDATDLQLFLLRPSIDGVLPPDKLTKIATFITDGRDGRIGYTTIVGDLSVAGTWKIQGRVTTPNGTWSSNIDKFKVINNL